LKCGRGNWWLTLWGISIIFLHVDLFYCKKRRRRLSLGLINGLYHVCRTMSAGENNTQKLNVLTC
jgi:hypothetical protein